MNTLIKQALERLVHLHLCEQEGLSSGQPTPEMWMEAVNQASEALQTAQSLPSMRQDLAKKLLAIRDEFAKEDYNEACHILYSISNPEFDSYEPWEYLEKIAAGESTEGEDAWVRVGGHELPHIGEWVLLYNGHWTGVGKRNRIEEGDHEETMWEDETHEYITPIPTHFMPLPKPPVNK
jgi:hypothetical protein